MQPLACNLPLSTLNSNTNLDFTYNSVKFDVFSMRKDVLLIITIHSKKKRGIEELKGTRTTTRLQRIARREHKNKSQILFMKWTLIKVFFLYFCHQLFLLPFLLLAQIKLYWIFMKKKRRKKNEQERRKKNVIFILKLTSFLYMLPYNMKFIFYYQLLCCFLCCCCCCVFLLSFLLLMHSISICTMLISSSYWIFYSAFFFSNWKFVLLKSCKNLFSFGLSVE